MNILNIMVRCIILWRSFLKKSLIRVSWSWTCFLQICDCIFSTICRHCSCYYSCYAMRCWGFLGKIKMWIPLSAKVGREWRKRWGDEGWGAEVKIDDSPIDGDTSFTTSILTSTPPTPDIIPPLSYPSHPHPWLDNIIHRYFFIVISKLVHSSTSVL